MHEHLERLESELATVLDGLDAREAQLTPKAHPAKWSIQQITEHLLLTYRSTLDLVQVRLEKGTATKAKPSMAQRAGQLTLIGLGYFPSGRKAPPAVCPMLPASLLTGEELTRRMRVDVHAMADALAHAESRFCQRPFASHAVLGPLSVAQWRKFHLVHGKHHVQQMRQIRRDWRVEERGKG